VPLKEVGARKNLGRRVSVLPLRWLATAGSLTALIAVPALDNRSLAQETLKPLDPAQWRSIYDTAQSYVDREWAGDPLPFKSVPLQQLQSAKRKVFAHYFTPFPLSIDNKPTVEDYYAENYLKRSGENNKFYDMGGYLRQRPLPVGPWQSPDWQRINLAIEVLRARRIGIDGFGIDLLMLDGPLWQQTLRLLEVASAVAHDFTIVPEPDMYALKEVAEADLITALVTLLKSPAIYHLPDGRALVVPFYAEAKPPAFWKSLSEALAKQGYPIALILDFVDPSGHKAYEPVSYGYTVWGLRDPLSLQLEETKNGFASFFRGRETQPIMLAIAPQDERPKEATFWEAHNTSTFRALWTKAIDSSAQFAHLITWNDYSEASEISPSSATQFVFYDLAAYYISWFKQGSVPEIQKDAIFYTHRRQILRPDARFEPKDKPFQLRGRTGLWNDIEMLAFLKAPAMMEIEIGGITYQKQGAPGLNSFMVSAQVGRPIFRLKRGSELVLETPSGFTIESKPDRIDPLYVGGNSMRHVGQ